ncbi:hypothetical protein NM688_g3298 [Phlebia brevispora]|uniref:Uncharacterized protein n=1 Tax=Phlebia brevispora TaxID=194682 RepID=A0ACC1T5W7_9APHY|nr:hypothetical protein NM688_g3298 [Phlebia brevispora]
MASRHRTQIPKYPLVVSFTDPGAVVQIVYTHFQGDFVLTAACSQELPRYGINHCLTNRTAVYTIDLLCVCRALTKLDLTDKYEGRPEPDGTILSAEAPTVRMLHCRPTATTSTSISTYVDCSEDTKEMSTNAYTAIREDPNVHADGEDKGEHKARIAAKIEASKAAAGAAVEGVEEEEDEEDEE